MTETYEGDLEPDPALGVETVMHGDVTRLASPVVIVDTGVPDLRLFATNSPDHGLQTQVVDLRAQMEARYGPFEVRDTRYVTSVGAFLAEIERRPLRPNHSTLWADRAQGTVTAVYDDHPGGLEEDGPGVDYDDRGTGRRQDRLVLALTRHEDWQAWLNLHDQFYDQESWGDRIELLAHTFIDPDGATMSRLVDNVRVASTASFEGRIERHSGSVTVNYREDNDVRTEGSIEFPQVVKLSTPIYEGYVVEQRFDALTRVKRDSNRLRVGFAIPARVRAERAAWEHVLEEINLAINPTDEVPDGSGVRREVVQTVFPILATAQRR